MEIDALYIKDCVGSLFSSPAEAMFDRFSEDRWCMVNFGQTIPKSVQKFGNTNLLGFSPCISRMVKCPPGTVEGRFETNTSVHWRLGCKDLAMESAIGSTLALCQQMWESFFGRPTSSKGKLIVPRPIASTPNLQIVLAEVSSYYLLIVLAEVSSYCWKSLDSTLASSDCKL